jgi:prephenate dehydrogenase
MKIFIVGLGLMGASYALALSQKNHEVYGFDHDAITLSKALNDKIIKSADLKKLETAELIILALYPKATLEFVQNNFHHFNMNALVTDLCGTKLSLIASLDNLLPKHIRFTSHHPMAGRAKGGYDNKNIEMFEQSNFIIVKTPRTIDNDIEVLTIIANELKFEKVTLLSALEHDKAIAFTSQLTHILAVSLMNANNMDNLNRLTGDSFKDLTRIADINVDMWSELFLESKSTLVPVIDSFVSVMLQIKDAIANDQLDLLHEQLNNAKMKKHYLDN